MLSGARAREGERLLHSSRLQTPFAVKASFVPSFRRKERVNKVWYLSRRDIWLERVKERYRTSAQLSNKCEHVFAPKKDTSTTIKTREEDKKQQTLEEEEEEKREGKKISFFFKAVVFFTLLYSLCRALFCSILFKQIWRQLLRPSQRWFGNVQNVRRGPIELERLRRFQRERTHAGGEEGQGQGGGGRVQRQKSRRRGEDASRKRKSRLQRVHLLISHDFASWEKYLEREREGENLRECVLTLSVVYPMKLVWSTKKSSPSY